MKSLDSLPFHQTLMAGPSDVPLDSLLTMSGLEEFSSSLKSLVCSSSLLSLVLLMILAVVPVAVVVEELDEVLVTETLVVVVMILFLLDMAFKGIISRSDVKDLDSEIPEETDPTSSSWFPEVSSFMTLVTSPFSARSFSFFDPVSRLFLSFFNRCRILFFPVNASFVFPLEPNPL